MTSSISPRYYYYILRMHALIHATASRAERRLLVVIYYYRIMTTDALLFARVVSRVAYHIINTTKCGTAACCSTRAPDADDLSVISRRLLTPCL
jgi:hypothetical protein